MLWPVNKRGNARKLARRSRRGLYVLCALFGLSVPLSLHAEEPSEEAHQECEPPAWLTGDEPAFSFESALGPIEYRAGRGMRIGDTGLNIGGFSTFEFDREENGAGQRELDSVSFLLLWEPHPRFRAFAEVDLDSLYTYDTKESESRSNPQHTLERVYGELRLVDAASLRIGKFQTPIGRWNLVPAEPFVWTASSPIVVEEAFDQHQTGAAVLGSVHRTEGTLRYWVYGQATDPIDASEDPPAADSGVGGRLQWDDPLGRWSIGGSYLAARTGGDWSHLGGADAALRFGPLELTSELTLVRGDGPVRDVWGAYLQGVLDVVYGFHLVARYEYFDPVADDDVSLLDAGVAWTPLPWLRLKADYRISTRETDFVTRGLNTSISIVF